MKMKRTVIHKNQFPGHSGGAGKMASKITEESMTVEIYREENKRRRK